MTIEFVYKIIEAAAERGRLVSEGYNDANQEIFRDRYRSRKFTVCYNGEALERS